MRFVLPLAVMLAQAGCASAPSPALKAPDYESPFTIILAEYSVPVALALGSPGTVGGWEDGGRPLRDFVQGWTHRPRRDDVDNDFVNYGLHPLSGSETHMIARRHGWSFGEAFLFDAFGSLAWEYVFENVFEPPSRTDLLVTAPIGALLGELRWQAKQAGILPGLMDPLDGHGEPFVGLDGDSVVLGLSRKF